MTVRDLKKNWVCVKGRVDELGSSLMVEASGIVGGYVVWKMHKWCGRCTSGEEDEKKKEKGERERGRLNTALCPVFTDNRGLAAIVQNIHSCYVRTPNGFQHFNALSLHGSY